MYTYTACARRDDHSTKHVVNFVFLLYIAQHVYH